MNEFSLKKNLKNIFFLFQLKKLSLNQEKPLEDLHTLEKYKRNNKIQINKIRSYVRKSNYLLDPYTKRAHVSIDKNVEMSEDLINFPEIAMENATKFIEAKLNDEAPKLVPVFVTEKEKEEYCSLYNKTIKQITTIILNLIENLDDAKAKLQREIFEKTVKRKKKEKYIEFLFKLHDEIDSLDGEIEVEI